MVFHENALKLYHDPAMDKVYIDCSKEQMTEMQIINTIEKCLLQKVLITGTNVFDISSFANGFYIITFKGNNWTTHRKLIKK